jgi:aminopeptidase N
MRVSALTVDGDKTAFSQAKWHLTVDRRLRTDRRVTVDVTYSGTPKQVPGPSEGMDSPPGLGITTDGERGRLWTFQEPYGALTWYPVNDHPSDEALYDIDVTVPHGYSGVASGKFKGREKNTFRWSSGKDPVASYLTTLAVDRFERIDMTGPHRLPITAWLAPGNADWRPALKRMPEMLSWLEKHYGRYPFDSAGLVIVGGANAMESQQMVTLSGDLDSGSSGEALIVHELSHQWFGDSATPRDWRDLWLNEGPATYTEQMWKVDHHVRDLSDILDYWNGHDQKLRDDYGPPGDYYSDYYSDYFADNNVYVCTALMLYHLRTKLGGREALDNLLSDWVSQHANKSVTRRQFVAFVNRETGTDLTDFFDSWLDSDTTPRS